MKDLLHALRLSHVEAGLPDLYEQARLHSLTYESFLRRVLTMEIEGRKLAAQQQRLKAARLPARKTLDEFEFGKCFVLDDVALFYLLSGGRRLDHARDDVAYARFFRVGAFLNPDAHDFTRAAVIRRAQSGIGSNHIGSP